MSDVTCVCGQPAPDGGICSACVNRLAAALDQLPDLWTELETRLAGTKGVDYSRLGGSRSSETPLAIDRGAYEARDVIHNTIQTWARALIEDGCNYESEVSQWPPF